ncbi:nitrate reductase cytochrome c-type subunit [Oceanomicrobium pacificus]|uniref:Periplasmic nitrate reductase, electron transfer subunit n=1 Tax=Oceanomicrobium pacificus TaxID=2692916 RepID=A0A6B0U084_9RHOB|nr:nitrate reductase cytochrome c-type subunit [Oceanomicrobium pacificus]MXU66663.1 nitrate reductase cytochrome c-type subunit; periplasmic nitrate reductase electron transfer subunit [Oceanomicrobium pacificus]
MTQTARIPTLAALIVALAAPVLAQQSVATLRGPADLAENGPAQPIPAVVNSDIRQVRNYPEQPPLIPHKIDGYQITSDYNQCLTCHSRTAIEVSQAPMVSITHFMDREGQFLASISPRRFFCTQCHVPQSDARPLVENEFVDVDTVLDYVTSHGGSD